MPVETVMKTNMPVVTTSSSVSLVGGQKGFALLEALVAILVFSLGILGTLGLQVSMNNEQTSAKLRSDASFLASGLIGSMWLDVANLNSYATANCGGYARCLEWRNKVAANLPQAVPTVMVDVATGDVLITLSWTMPNGEVHQYVTATTIVAA